MVERRPWLDILAHFILLCGVALVAFPIYVTFVASTQTAQEVASAPMSLIPGKHFVDNYMQALFAGSGGGSYGAPPLWDAAGQCWSASIEMREFL